MAEICSMTPFKLASVSSSDLTKCWQMILCSGLSRQPMDSSRAASSSVLLDCVGRREGGREEGYTWITIYHWRCI